MHKSCEVAMTARSIADCLVLRLCLGSANSRGFSAPGASDFEDENMSDLLNVFLKILSILDSEYMIWNLACLPSMSIGSRRTQAYALELCISVAL